PLRGPSNHAPKAGPMAGGSGGGGGAPGLPGPATTIMSPNGLRAINVPFGSVVYAAMFSSTYQLWFSSTSMKPATSSRSTSVGDPSGRAIPLRVTISGPIRPLATSRISSLCEWYIQNAELPSCGDG